MTDEKKDEKKRILAWSDSASVFTGFGIVSRYILRALHTTGKYEIFQLAINSPTRFVDTNEVPWQQISTRLLDPSDPYGKKLFLRTVSESEFDYIWILNDIYVTYDVAEKLRDICVQKAAHGNKVPKIVYYYPIDCHAQNSVTDMVLAADVSVCYNDYGRKETLETHPDIEERLRQIPHGVDTKNYRPLGREVQKELKTKYLKGNADKFAFISVNRNSDRKQLARAILAFSEFKKEVPNSVLLLHTMPIDRSMGRSIDLFAAVKDLGLSLTEDVLFPKYYEPSRGFPVETMNEIYNFADCFIHTSLGEGYGLSVAESCAAGTPIVVPDNTNMRDFTGKDGERGYIYPCREKVFVDNCYTLDTEVLTKDGWKYYQDLSYRDKICTLNPDTHFVEYQKPLDLIYGDYDGRLYSLKHSGKLKVDMLVTENHNIYAAKVKNNGTVLDWQFMKPADVFGKRYIAFKKDAKWRGLQIDYYHLPSRSIPMKLWMEFIGYYLSEGSCTYAKGSHFIVQLRQSPGPVLDRMERLMKDMGYNPHIRRDKKESRVVVYDKELYEYVKPLGKKHEKYIPRDILNLSSDYLKILFESLMVGDGHNLYYRDYNERDTVKTRGGSSYSTSSVRLRDDFQELLLKIGYSGSYSLLGKKGREWHIEGRSGITKYDLWGIGVSYKCNSPSKRSGYKKQNDKWIKRDTWKEEWVQYSGKVWCVTVPNHIIYVRRNGCVMWSGNSGFRPMGRLDDIVYQMIRVYRAGNKYDNTKVKLAREWAEKNDWSIICEQWIELFKESGIEQPKTMIDEIKGMLI